MALSSCVTLWMVRLEQSSLFARLLPTLGLSAIGRFSFSRMKRTRENRSGPREGGSRAMEEIRKQRLVRGDRRRIKGIRLTGGLVIRRCELPRVCY